MRESALGQTGDAEYTILVFFSNFNERSLRASVAIREFVESHPRSGTIAAKEISYEDDRDICAHYGVTGTPALFLFRKQELIGRHFGEITSDELATLLEEALGAD